MGDKLIYLVGVSTCQVISKIIGPKRIFSIKKCDNNTILCANTDNNNNNNLLKYKYDAKFGLIKSGEIIKAHNTSIYSCFESDGDIIISSAKGIVKFWKNCVFNF